MHNRCNECKTEESLVRKHNQLTISSELWIADYYECNICGSSYYKLTNRADHAVTWHKDVGNYK